MCPKYWLTACSSLPRKKVWLGELTVPPWPKLLSWDAKQQNKQTNSMGSQGTNVSSGGKLRLWSDCADAQIYLKFRRTDMPTCTLCWIPAHLCWCKFENSREKFIFANSVRRHNCDIKKSGLRHDFPTAVNGRVISPFREGFIFTKLCKVSRK